jgi:hypothetical protein
LTDFSIQYTNHSGNEKKENGKVSECSSLKIIDFFGKFEFFSNLNKLLPAKEKENGKN